jgi:cytochrome P450
VEIYRPLDSTMLTDPYPVYAELRRQDPIHWHEQLNSYVLTRYRDCDRVLQDSETFAADPRRVGEEIPEEFLGLLSLQWLDPPDHGVVRQIVLDGLKGVDLNAWLADVRAVADKLLSAMGEDELDFVTEFAEPLAARSLCSLFGLPLLEEEKVFLTAQRDLVLQMDVDLAPERGPAGLRARAYLSGLIEPWAVRPPATGLLSRIDFAAAGELHSFLINSLRAIMVAGFTATSSMLGNAVRVLAENGFFGAEEPPAITTTMIHELIRYVGPLQTDFRTVVQDVQLGERMLTRSDIVIPVLGAANRDPSVFDEPDQLRLDRDPNPHLGFGAGVHACLGGRLALRILLDVLGSLAKTYQIELVGEPVQRPTAMARGLDRLPLRLRIR